LWNAVDRQPIVNHIYVLLSSYILTGSPLFDGQEDRMVESESKRSWIVDSRYIVNSETATNFEPRSRGELDYKVGHTLQRYCPGGIPEWFAFRRRPVVDDIPIEMMKR
jgi:hypothetical protein